MSDDISKTQTEFYITNGDQNFGPWAIEEIAARIKNSEITISDFIYVDAVGDWIPLMECDALKEHLRKSKPKPPPPMAKSAKSETAKPSQPETPAKQHKRQESIQHEEWFVQKGANRFGPFSYYGLVRALQEKSVYDFDFVWREGMPTWIRIAEHEEFHPDRIRALADRETTETEEVFFRRQFNRIPFDSEVIVHDDRSVWLGQSFEASVGGSGVMIQNSTLTPGQVVRLHFAPCDGLPAFNALGEIVGKRYAKDVCGAKSPVRYSVRFLKLDGSVEPTVREYFETKAAG